MKTSRAARPQKSCTSPTGEQLLSPRIALIVAVTLIAGVFAIYSPALDFQFILDDHHFVNDPRLQTSGHIWEYFTSYVWAQIPGGPVSFYRPIFALWLRLNFILSGMSPWGWHLLSIAKHVLVAALLGMLVWTLLRDRIAALIAGVLFALHPAQTESVAWVTVPDPLMAAAALGTVLLYLRYVDGASVTRRSETGRSDRKLRKQSHGKSSDDVSINWLAASAVACLAALMAKETAIVLPVMLLAVAVFVPAGTGGEALGKGSRSPLAAALRGIIPFVGATLAYLALRFHALGGRISPPTQHLPWGTVLLSWPATLWFYVKVLLWPIHSRAFADPSVADTFSVRGVLLPGFGVACSLAVILWGCVWAWRRAWRDLAPQEAVRIARALLLGGLMLVLPLLLALNLNALDPGDFLHGRYTYLPLAGLMLLLATAWHVAKEGKWVLICAAGVVVIAFSVLTLRQESMWKDDLTAFTVAHEIAPHNLPVTQNLVRAHVQIALSLDEEGRCDEAMPMFDQAIEQFPQDWFAWAGRGECFFKLNDLPKAEQSLRRAAELSHEARVKEEWEEVRRRMGLGVVPLE